MMEFGLSGPALEAGLQALTITHTACQGIVLWLLAERPDGRWHVYVDEAWEMRWGKGGYNLYKYLTICCS